MEKLFGTDGVRGKANQGVMTAETALKLGRAVALYFQEGHADDEVRPTIVIGRDPRLSGSMLEAALTAGVCSAGVDVRLLGVVPTPAVAQIAVRSGAVAGLMVSASHNPFYDNGVKVFKGDGFKLNDDEEALVEAFFHAKPDDLPVGEDVGTVFSMENAADVYAGFCMNVLSTENALSGLKLILDCSNGAASECAGHIFEGLGAKVETIHDDPDGININDQCGSQHTQKLSSKVIAAGADAGLAFDGDGDRLIAVDELGVELTGDQVLAICAKAYKDSGLLAGNCVVATVMSNIGFHAAMESLDIETKTVGVGDRKVLEFMRRNQTVLGGEDSGHMIFLDCHTTGDGIVSGLKLMQVLKEANTGLSDLAQVMTPYPQTLINVDVRKKPPVDEVDGIVKAIAEAEAELGREGRILIRYSGTQPMCRVMVEGPTVEQTDSIAEHLAAVVKECIG